MSEIKLDKRNYRKHSERNKQLINKSLKDLGAGRSILIDNQNEIIAGNGVFEQARELNIPIKVIETDGSELIAIKRNDLSTEDDKRKRLSIMDNSASDSSEFDFELLSEDFNQSELLEMGINIEDLETLGDSELESLEDDTYTKVINPPQYEIKGESPSLNECCDIGKAKELIKEISESSLTQEQKDFLTFAAYRHLSFNYINIAEYYAHAPKEMQELMEKSALVIIDYENALKNGYVKLNKQLLELFNDR